MSYNTLQKYPKLHVDLLQPKYSCLNPYQLLVSSNVAVMTSLCVLLLPPVENICKEPCFNSITDKYSFDRSTTVLFSQNKSMFVCNGKITGYL